jgi:hypothetical protein
VDTGGYFGSGVSGSVKFIGDVCGGTFAIYIGGQTVLVLGGVGILFSAIFELVVYGVGGDQ